MSEIIKRPPIEKDKIWALEETGYSKFRVFTIEQGLKYIFYIESLESSLESKDKEIERLKVKINHLAEDLKQAIEITEETSGYPGLRRQDERK